MKTLSEYDQGSLNALYAAADFMSCNDLPTDEVMAAIELIESKLQDEQPVRFKISYGPDGDVRWSRKH